MTEINDRFIEEMRINKKLCGHLHISLQSGSERVLKIMNRKYTKAEYKEKVNMSKTAGRKKKTDDKQIYDLAHQGKTAKEVAEILGIGKSTVEHSDGWTQRNQDEFIF